MSGKRPSEGIPELVFMLACPMHVPDPGLGKGLFKIADKGLGKMSVSQLLTHVEALVEMLSLGVEWQAVWSHWRMPSLSPVRTT